MKTALRTLLLTITAGLLLGSGTKSEARCCGGHYEPISGYRTYNLYPYYSAVGPRQDPYWSYTASYYPYNYNGDGSYYGIGYSPSPGRDWYGTYWYW